MKDIPDHWVKTYVDSENLLSFGIKEPIRRAIVPSDFRGALLSNKSARESSHSWRELDEAYQHNKGIGKTTPNDLITQINFQKKWETQFPLKTSVIYNGSGQKLRAAVGKLAIGHTLFRLRLSSQSECHYVCAMLNASSLSLLFTFSRVSDRHFQKNPLNKVPIPRFDRNDWVHARLAELSQSLHLKDRQNKKWLNEVSELAAETLCKVDPRYEEFIQL